MNSIKTAVILLDPPPEDYPLLLEHKVATVPLFKRWVLTLDRSGIETIFVISRKLDHETMERISTDIKKDRRFRKKLIWYDQEKFLNSGGMAALRGGVEVGPCILSSGNVVASFLLIRSFIKRVLTSGSLARKPMVSLAPRQVFAGGIHLLNADALDIVEAYARDQQINENTESIHVNTKTGVWATVGNEPSTRDLENRLIKNQKYHHGQVMDRLINMILSSHITRFLLHTPVTPNQISLFGVFLGFVSCYFFSMGNYWGGLLGGFFAASTTVADCCDGEIARLKFLDSDEGEYLDRVCDNIINVLVFLGIAIGMVQKFGWFSAILPGILMTLGGGTIFSLIYSKKGEEKGALFQGTGLYKIIQKLATRDFLYIVLAFGIMGKAHWFLWIAAVGSVVFAGILYKAKRKMIMVCQT